MSVDEIRAFEGVSLFFCVSAGLLEPLEGRALCGDLGGTADCETAMLEVDVKGSLCVSRAGDSLLGERASVFDRVHLVFVVSVLYGWCKEWRLGESFKTSLKLARAVRSAKM